MAIDQGYAATIHVVGADGTYHHWYTTKLEVARIPPEAYDQLPRFEAHIRIDAMTSSTHGLTDEQSLGIALLERLAPKQEAHQFALAILLGKQDSLSDNQKLAIAMLTSEPKTAAQKLARAVILGDDDARAPLVDECLMEMGR